MQNVSSSAFGVQSDGSRVPVVRAAVTNDELPFLSNNFIKRYQGYVGRPPMRWPVKLVGEGGEKQLRLIGDKAACNEVMKGGDVGYTLVSPALRITDILDEAVKRLEAQS